MGHFGDKPFQATGTEEMQTPLLLLLLLPPLPLPTSSTLWIWQAL